jgi:hypothetical protein
MKYKCKKCGSTNVEVLEVKKFGAEAVIRKEGEPAFEDRTEIVGKMLACKDCNYDGSRSDFDRV